MIKCLLSTGEEVYTREFKDSIEYNTEVYVYKYKIKDLHIYVSINNKWLHDKNSATIA